MQLAQFNIGRLRYDMDDPRVVDFVNGIDILNRIAERADGFVWKFETGEGGVVDTDVDGDPRIVVNMTVWDSADSLKRYVWNTLHKHFYGRRKEWFEPMEKASFVMWWVPDGHQPSLREALAKLDHLRAHGDSDAAFGWSVLDRVEAARRAPKRAGGVVTSALSMILALMLPVAAPAETLRSDTLTADMTRHAVAMRSDTGATISAEQVHVSVTRRDGQAVAGGALQDMVPFAEKAACRGRQVMVSLVLGVSTQGAGLYEVLCARGS